MSRTLLLRIAAVLSFLTAIGHTIGTFMPVPPEHEQMHSTIAIMKRTMIPMPMGSAKSYMQVLDGNNLCTTVLVLLCGALLVWIATAAKERVVDGVILLNALALAGVSIISFLYFFPAPAVFTGVAAVLALLARGRAHGTA